MNETPRTEDETFEPLQSDRSWLAQYPDSVRANIPIPAITLPEILSRTRSQYQDHICATFFGREYTYREIDDASNVFARGLIELGLQADDRVFVLLPNVPQFLVVAYGVLKAGGVLAAVNPLLTKHEIRDLVIDAGAKIVVTLDRFWPAIEQLISDRIVNHVIVTGVQDGLPTIKRWMYPFKYRKELVKVPYDDSLGVLRYRHIMSIYSASPVETSRTPSDMAAFQYTGGTTGLPKAAVLTHHNLVANAHQVREWLVESKMGEVTALAVLPFFHAYGGTLCLYLAVQLAAKIVLIPRFDINEVVEAIDKHRPTFVPGVPTLFDALIRAANGNPRRSNALRSIRYCVSGGAPLPLKTQTRLEELTGGRVVEGYGLSEASPVTHVNPLDGQSRNGTIGLPLPNTEARLVEHDSRSPVEPGQPGELQVRGPQVMREYWNRPKETEDVLDHEGWLRTGDIATMDEDGYFTIVDRIKDVIITGGENIYPSEVEKVLTSHPRISEVVVAGIPHSVAGEIAKAYIVLEDGQTMTRGDVVRYCSEQLARYKIPRRVEFRTDLPKSAMGKVLRRKLESPASVDDLESGPESR